MVRLALVASVTCSPVSFQMSHESIVPNTTSPASARARHPSRLFSIQVSFGPETFEALTELSNEEFYARLTASGAPTPRTAAPNPPQFAAAYHAALEDGATSVVCVTISRDPHGQPVTFDPSGDRDPYQYFNYMRATEPVWRGTIMDNSLTPPELVPEEEWTFFDFNSVFRAFRDDELFGSEHYNETIGLVFGPTILGMHGKQHHDHRSLVSKAFRQTALERWEPAVIDPISAGLKWAVDLSKEFVGFQKLREIDQAGPKRKLVGLELEGKRTARQGYPVLKDGATIGEVTSGALSPTLGKSIAMAYVDANHTAEGTDLSVDLKGTANPVPWPLCSTDCAAV